MLVICKNWGGKFKEVYNESDVLVKPLSGSPVLGSTWYCVSPVLWPPVRAQSRGERFVLGHSLHRHQEGLLIRTGEHLPRHPSEEDRWPDQSVRILWKKQGEVSPAVETRKHQRWGKQFLWRKTNVQAFFNEEAVDGKSECKEWWLLKKMVEDRFFEGLRW